MAEKLSVEARKAALGSLNGWSEVPGREAISRTFTFKNFNEAFGFMTRVYKTVEVVLTTHDAGGVTQRDIALAESMNKIAG
jgi:4a-hydroxytetrahydrobiopterin dehydratase